MTVVWQMLLVSKEAFSLLSMSKMAAVGMDMDIEVYGHSQNFIFMFSTAARQRKAPRA